MDTSSNNNAQRSEINVTPLIDVLLVLLIIFMVIQPTAVRGLDTLVPQPPKSHQPSESDSKAIVVQIFDNQHGATYKINEDSFDKSAIEPELARIFANRNDKVMFVRADAALNFSTVAEVIDFGHQAGVSNVGIITQKSATNTGR